MTITTVDDYLNIYRVTCAAAFMRFAFTLSACLVVGACKPDETEVREYLPSHFSEAVVQESKAFPLLCTSVAFRAVLDTEQVANIPLVRKGPIAGNVSDNSIVYRVVNNAGRRCPLTSVGDAKIRGISDYLSAEDTFFVEPEAGKLIIFDTARNSIIFLEG